MAVQEDVTLEVDGINIVGRLYSPDTQAEKRHHTVCICHGIPGPFKTTGDPGYPALAERLAGEGFDAFIFNFRGTGESGGNFDIAGWARDLAAMIDFLVDAPATRGNRLSLMGFSGGAAVSTFIAAQDARVSAVVLCAGPAEFKNFTDMENAEAYFEQARQIGIFRDKDFPPSTEGWTESFKRIRPEDWIDRISPRPLFIIHGDADSVVDVSHAWRLYEKAREPKFILILPGGEHRLRLDERAMQAAIEWLKSVDCEKQRNPISQP